MLESQDSSQDSPERLLKPASFAASFAAALGTAIGGFKHRPGETPRVWCGDHDVHIKPLVCIAQVVGLVYVCFPYLGWVIAIWQTDLGVETNNIIYNLSQQGWFIPPGRMVHPQILQLHRCHNWWSVVSPWFVCHILSLKWCAKLAVICASIQERDDQLSSDTLWETANANAKSIKQSRMTHSGINHYGKSPAVFSLFTSMFANLSRPPWVNDHFGRS